MMDLITTEVIRSKCQALLGEMRFLLFRSAYSSLVRESRDCSFGLCTADGEIPFQGSGLHLYVYGSAVRRLRQMVPADEFRPGDVFIGNDPHEIGVPHSPDVMVLTPLLYQGRLICFCASMAHKMDFGGAVPGTIYSGATDVFQEGLRLPLMKYYDRGTVVPQVQEIIRANVRNADIVLGDLGAQIGATLMAVERVQTIAARYSVDTLEEAFQELLSSPRLRIAKLVEKWPGHTAEAETYLDPPPSHDQPVRLHLRITRDEGHLTFDFRGSDTQVRSPINVTPPALLYMCCTSLLGLTDAGIFENAGVARAVTLMTREGTVAHATPPFPVGNTTMVLPAYVDIIMRTLSELKGTGGIATRGGHGTTAFAWRNGLVGGRKYVQYEIQAASTGGTAWRDGLSAVNPLDCQYSAMAMENSLIQDTPAEILEAQYPVRLLRYELIPDSGGPGTYRGGCAPRRVYEALAPADLNVRHAKGFSIAADGVDGGRAGRRGRVLVRRAGRPETVVEDWKCELSPGDRVTFEGGGGGGCGDPFQRRPEQVAHDVEEGFVSVRGARDDYGVVLRRRGSKLALDLEGTRQRRAGG
jgi:N-methylhydantoinase B/oxoprolinase/acetone carboxylase alpha subunit